MKTCRIQADYEQLRQIAQILAQQATTCQQTTQSIQTHKATLQNGDWVGQGAMAFYAEMDTSILPSPKRLANALAQASQIVLHISGVMYQAEQDAAAVFHTFGAKSDWGEGAQNVIEGKGSATATPTPPPPEAQRPPPGVIPTVNQQDLSVFFSQWEESLPKEAQAAYLTHPDLLPLEIALRDQIIANWQSGNPPLNPNQVYQMALETVQDPGTALLICHNVMKAFARGGETIHWQRVEGTIDRYTDGTHEYQVSVTEANQAIVQPPGFEKPSAFYLMFSMEALGNSDPGDWYHYFANATTAYYGATGRAGGAGLTYADSVMTSRYTSQQYADVIGREVQNLMTQMQSEAPISSAEQGWRWANALSFLEGGHYGGKAQEEVLRESLIHLQGATYGLTLAGHSPANHWGWYVPMTGSIPEPGLNEVMFNEPVVANLATVTDKILDAQGNMTELTPPPNDKNNNGGQPER